MAMSSLDSWDSGGRPAVYGHIIFKRLVNENVIEVFSFECFVGIDKSIKFEIKKNNRKRKYPIISLLPKVHLMVSHGA